MTYSLSGTKTLRLKWRAAFERWERAAGRWVEAAKAGFNQNQPRVPSGNSGGGRWTGGSGGGGRSTPKKPKRRAQSPRPQKRKPSPVKKLTAPVTKKPRRTGGQLPVPPRISRHKPPFRQMERRVAKETAKWLLKAGARRALGPIGIVLDAIDSALWLREHYPEMQSYFDEPKSLKELRDAVSDPVVGYEMHHIVERGPADLDGFPGSMIDAPENIVRTPAWKHREITNWYQTRNDRFDNLSPREFLRGKGWAERKRVGHIALVRHGVLKP